MANSDEVPSDSIREPPIPNPKEAPTTNWKHLLIAAVLAVTVSYASPADAGSATLELRPGQSQALSMCKGASGTVEIKQSGEQLSIVFTDAACATVDVYRTGEGKKIHKTY